MRDVHAIGLPLVSPVQRVCCPRQCGAASRARAMGVPFDASPRMLAKIESGLASGHCAATGLAFSTKVGAPGQRAKGSSVGPYRPSIDRINPALGYTPDNIRIVCWAFNAMVGSWGDDVAAQVAEAFLAKRAERAALEPASTRPRNPHAALELHHAPRVFRPSPVVTFEGATILAGHPLEAHRYP